MWCEKSVQSVCPEAPDDEARGSDPRGRAGKYTLLNGSSGKGADKTEQRPGVSNSQSKTKINTQSPQQSLNAWRMLRGSKSRVHFVRAWVHYTGWGALGCLGVVGASKVVAELMLYRQLPCC